MKKRYKKVAESQTEQTYLMRPMYLNGYGNLFGGQLMSWIDEIASIVAMRHSESDITTAAIDNLNFKSGATVEDVIVLRGKITYVGRTSMEVCGEPSRHQENDQSGLCSHGSGGSGASSCGSSRTFGGI